MVFPIRAARYWLGTRVATLLTNPKLPSSLEVEGLRNEDGHLPAVVGVRRAVVAAAAAGGDAFGIELLDPVGEGSRAGNVREDSRRRAGRRRVAGSVLALEQEDRHLVAADGAGGAVVAGSAAPGDALVGQGLDPVGVGRRAGHVAEEAGRAVGRHVAEAVLALQEKHGHLLARYVGIRAIVA